MVYAIYEEFFPDVEKKLNRIANKCKKCGNDFAFKVKGEEVRAIKKITPVDMIGMPKPVEYLKFILVDVEGTAKIDNWECIAVLEVNDIGNIIRRINTEIEVPERFKTSKNICEHCNSKRGRKNLFVIHNVETDEWKQVGGDCLNLYTGGLNMEYVTAYLDGITELEEFDGFIGESRKHYYPVKDVLAFAVEIINKMGYFNSKSDCPTKGLVMIMEFFDSNERIRKLNEELASAKLDVRFSRNDFFLEETRETVDKIIDYYLNLNDESEFVHNVKIMLQMEYVQAKDFGFLCYLPEGYAKYINEQKERAKRIDAKHFGEIGKRYKDIEVLCMEVIASWETQWGVTMIYKFTLADGTILIWKTSTGIYFDRGEVLDKITFTVKEHTEYKGDKQTEITRCKVTMKVA